jgi:predicted small secreted protein
MELHMSRKFVSPLLALALLAGGVSLAACNTVEGVGEDVQAAGQSVEEAAEEAQDTPDA